MPGANKRRLIDEAKTIGREQNENTIQNASKGGENCTLQGFSNSTDRMVYKATTSTWCILETEIIFPAKSC